MINQLHKITIATSFPIFPPQNPHAHRIFNLYRHLAVNLRIEIISLAEEKDDYFTGIIAPGLSEIRIPKSDSHRHAEREIRQTLGSHESNFSLIELCKLTPQYLSALKKSAHQAIAIICHQPYLLPIVSQCHKPIWYEATGIESELHANLFSEDQIGIDFMQSIEKVEKQCCQESDFIITASSNIAKQITGTYNISPEKIICIPNGVDSFHNQFISYQQRLTNKEKLGLKEGFLVIFMGNGNPHNIEEVKIVLNIASKLRKVNFLILGNIGINLHPRLIPTNVNFIPNLDPEIKSFILDTADVAINPVLHNYNNQAQMIEYFARGIPIISTHLGIEEFDFKRNRYCLVGEIWQFPELILIAKQEKNANKEMRIKDVRNYVLEKFQWNKISHDFLNFIADQYMAS